MKKVKTAALTGLALDWAVAKIQGAHRAYLIGEEFIEHHKSGKFHYSTDWAKAGQIIEREGIDLRQAKHAKFSIYSYYRPEHFPDAEIIQRPNDRGPDRALKVRNKPHPMDGKWMAQMSRGTGTTIQWSKEDFLSDTPLIAAMRCYVAYKMGAEIEIPEELYGK